MSKICSENFTEETLHRLQLTQVEILDEIVRICDKHNLSYCLIGGTLLGAIRHEGFIPWDDDLDISMPRIDYERFCSLCSSELNDSYYLHDINTDNKYWLIFAKIRKKNTLLDETNISHLDVDKGIYVDIFPLDDVKCEINLIQRIRTKIIKRLSSEICSKRGLKISYKSILSETVSICMRPFSINQLCKLQLSLMKKDDGKNYQYYINYGSNYETVKQTMLKTKYEPWKKVKFEGKLYNVPHDSDYVLSRIYGDYMQLPPEEKRILRHKPIAIDFGDDADGKI